ncbi:GNAT family N-acetyltransferase [Sphingomonas sp. GC_Shp_3]|uniref:GNAT family N-acetyltransferase n=1 Tax=Sphingomonas sp. GC_Shp_3 TaxID=2937383 RepID=UPI00226AEB7E
MTTAEDAKPNIIEPLDPTKHDRAAFSCGITQVDNFFRRTANKLAKADNVRTFVMVSPTGELIGFYATNAHAIDYTELPERFARNRPAHGSIPAAYISMIGVDSRFQRQGYGGDLLVDCLTRLASAANALGIAVVMLDVLDCGDPERVARRLALYTSYGFELLPSNGLRLFLPIATIRMLTNDRD